MKSPRAIAAVRRMPPLDHNPNRGTGQPFNYGDSKVVAYLVSHPDVLHWLFGHVKEQGLIRFNPETGLWQGVEE